MNLLLLGIMSSVLICPSWGGLSQTEFETTIEENCFNQEDEVEPLLIIGQVNPLSQTLENFIALAEEFEAANPNVRIKEELFHFVRNYIFENIEYRDSGDVGHWIPKEFQGEILNTYWEPEKTEKDKESKGINVPYSTGEICSLFFMLSHSILTRAAPEEKLRSATNDTIFNFKNRQESYIKDKTLFPMEIGVVDVKGTKEAVALGKVLTGLYVGLQQNTKRSILDDKPAIPQEKVQDETMIDTLYALTMAEVISLGKWRPEVGNREGITGNGIWMSLPVGTELDTKDVCPMIYKLGSNVLSSESYSSLRGAADGLILGKVIKSIVKAKEVVKLSEILRMYYSRGGITAKTDESIELWASHCNREANLAVLEKFILPQVKLYQLLVSSSYKLIDENVIKAWELFQTVRPAVFGKWTTEFRDMCSADLSVDTPENLPLESPLDIIAVIDTNYGVEFVRKQQLILGYAAKELELRYYGSRMTVLVDQKMSATNSANNGAVALKPLFEDTFSSACAACYVTQFTPEEQGTPAVESEVLLAIDQLLQAKKENETKTNGVKGKVVIYFNFKEEKTNTRINPEEVREENALKDLLLRHIDVAVFALGRSHDLIKKYGRNKSPFIMSAVDETEDIVGKELAKRIAKYPASLQYPDCEKATSEHSAVYEDYVSRNSLQHWQMPARYFYKSRELKFTFESTFGSVKVCHNRATYKTEIVEDNCKKGTKVEFKDSNPCKGHDEITCSPYFFSVMGINTTDDTSTRGVCVDTTTENKCKAMDQIKFKVIHEGIRCSGCSGLFSTPVLLLLGGFVLHFLSKRH